MLLPEGVHLWDLSLVTRGPLAGKFRWRLADEIMDPESGLIRADVIRADEEALDTWYCTRSAGQFYVLHADSARFHMSVSAELVVDGDTAYTYPPDEEDMAKLDHVKVMREYNFDKLQGVRYDYENIPTEIQHWRLCADKQARAWRLRNDTLDAGKRIPDNLWEVADYRGMINHNWFDGGTHIFHDGRVYVDVNGIARFYDAQPPTLDEWNAPACVLEPTNG